MDRAGRGYLVFGAAVGLALLVTSLITRVWDILPAAVVAAGLGGLFSFIGKRYMLHEPAGDAARKEED